LKRKSTRASGLVQGGAKRAKGLPPGCSSFRLTVPVALPPQSTHSHLQCKVGQDGKSHLVSPDKSRTKDSRVSLSEHAELAELTELTSSDFGDDAGFSTSKPRVELGKEIEDGELLGDGDPFWDDIEEVLGADLDRAFDDIQDLDDVIDYMESLKPINDFDTAFDADDQPREDPFDGEAIFPLDGHNFEPPELPSVQGQYFKFKLTPVPVPAHSYNGASFSCDAKTHNVDSSIPPSSSPALAPAHSYNGASCSCDAESHNVDSSILPSSSLQIDQTCAILTVLRLSFHRYHRYLICDCKSFLPLKYLKDHYKKKHVDLLRGGQIRTASKDFPSVVQHIVQSFGIPPDQDTVPFTLSSFQGPIAGISDAMLRFRCKCGASLKSIVVARVHWGAACKLNPSSTWNAASSSIKKPRKSFIHSHFPEEWTQQPFSFNTMGKRVTVLGSSTPAMPTTQGDSDIERYLVPSGLDSVSLPWLQELGWTRWRDEQIQLGLTPSALVSFVELPQSKGKNVEDFPPLHTREDKFMWVGRRIYIRLKEMLEDGNTWLDGTLELRSDLAAE
jgi:hypothetical protein